MNIVDKSVEKRGKLVDKSVFKVDNYSFFVERISCLWMTIEQNLIKC